MKRRSFLQLVGGAAAMLVLELQTPALVREEGLAVAEALGGEPTLTIWEMQEEAITLIEQDDLFGMASMDFAGVGDVGAEWIEKARRREA
jgi:hypothetical protein